jgi:hypothetical protein
MKQIKRDLPGHNLMQLNADVDEGSFKKRVIKICEQLPKDTEFIATRTYCGDKADEALEALNSQNL